MKTTISIHKQQFHINEQPTYAGRAHQRRHIEGLLFNTRMVQAIFDDENPDTAIHWRYPDTGTWDAERNTREFCAALPLYARHGVLGVTVGLQGGGSIYTPEIYNHYLNSAFTPEGELKPAYLERLRQILAAADDAGIIVIVNYFYWKQSARLNSDAAVRRATEAATDWLLSTGYTNILVDVMNECGDWWGGLHPQLGTQRIHELIELVQQTTLHGRRLLAGSSTGGGEELPRGRWQAVEDFHMPHGNGCYPDQLRAKLQRLKASDDFQRKPRPILVNEDTIFLDNLEACVDEYASWGFYCQGFGCDYADRMDWKTRRRESSVEALTGFQTVPVNWGIHTPEKRPFFERVAVLTGAGA
jgi:hypothetical protein